MVKKIAHDSICKQKRCKDSAETVQKVEVLDASYDWDSISNFSPTKPGWK